MPALVNQTVTVVNKSGKIVSTSKHLVNVFNEAKSAYNERKAEIKATRKNEAEVKQREREARTQLENLHLNNNDDTRSRRSSGSRRSSQRGSEDGRSIKRKPVPSRTDRPPVERGVSDSFYANDERPRRSSNAPSPLRNHAPAWDDGPRITELTRRNTDGMQLTSRHKTDLRRRNSTSSIDMDLAYGDLPPPLPETRREDELELRAKVSYLQKLLDEGNCVQHSATAMIDSLQKNPDSMAAVALTLAEISNIAAKMAPGALASMKGAFPAVLALLASPEFAIAAGVGVGITIIAFGSYKIIKRIKANKELEAGNRVDSFIEDGDGDAEPVDELREISRIEKWRRGIADEQAASVGTSVDGEFLTPEATKSALANGRLTEADLKPAKSEKGKKHKKKKSRSGSEVSSAKKGKSEKTKKEKEASLLRSLFKGASAKRKEREREREMAFV